MPSLSNLTQNVTFHCIDKIFWPKCSFKKKVQIMISSPTCFIQMTKNCHHIKWLSSLSVGLVAGSSWLVLLSVVDGYAGGICLLPKGDPRSHLTASCCVSGAPQTGLGLDCELDHTGLWRGLRRYEQKLIISLFKYWPVCIENSLFRHNVQPFLQLFYTSVIQK